MSLCARYLTGGLGSLTKRGADRESKRDRDGAKLTTVSRAFRVGQETGGLFVISWIFGISPPSCSGPWIMDRGPSLSIGANDRPHVPPCGPMRGQSGLSCFEPVGERGTAAGCHRCMQLHGGAVGVEVLAEGSFVSAGHSSTNRPEDFYSAAPRCSPPHFQQTARHYRDRS